jgi:hypothetical protein
MWFSSCLIRCFLFLFALYFIYQILAYTESIETSLCLLGFAGHGAEYPLLLFLTNFGFEKYLNNIFYFLKLSHQNDI